MLASGFRTIVMLLALFLILAGINTLGRAAVPVVKKANPQLGAAFEFVF